MFQGLSLSQWSECTTAWVGGWGLTCWTINQKQRGQTWNGPSNIPPPTKSHLPSFKQHLQLGTKYSNVWDYGEHLNQTSTKDERGILTRPISKVKNEVNRYKNNLLSTTVSLFRSGITNSNYVILESMIQVSSWHSFNNGMLNLWKWAHYMTHPYTYHQELCV